MNIKTLLAGVAGFVFLVGATALADPTYSIYSVPPLTNGGMLTYGLNGLGSYVGWTYSGGTYFGFMLGPLGQTTAIDPPSAVNTHPTGINNNNVVVGFFSDSSGATHGFMDAGGSYTTLNVPGAVSTYAIGVNNIGQVAGYYVDAKGITHGFIEYAGVFTTIDVPGAVATYGLSVNQEGEVVGSYFDGSEVRGFIYHNGTFQYVDYPNAAVTWLTGVNADGTIVGWSRSCDTCVADPFVRWSDPNWTFPFWAGGPGFQPTGIDDYGLDIGFASNVFPTTEGDEVNGGNRRPGAIPEPGTTVLVGAGAMVLLLAKRCLKKQ